MRNFTKEQKLAVSLVQDAQGEADHIDPYSRGGKTSVENCQILSSSANRKKGAFKFIPRAWQKEFFKKWNNRKPNDPFLLIAIPGGGKTMAALETYRKWSEAGSDRRLIVVVPSDNLRQQWKDEAALFGASLQTKEFGTDFKHGFQGGVATYALVANQPLVFRKLCSVAPTMVVFDEVHHCGDEAHYGRGITTAFELAKERLLMSGTPWKSDGQPIPFVKYDSEGYAVGDFVYDYPRALAEDVVRYLVFDHAKGSIKNDCTGEVEYLSQDISEEAAKKRLRKLLDPEGDYVREQIASAHRKLVECRRSIPDAAAMAACIDQYHAIKIAKVIKEVTGCNPSVIVSDSDLENDSVKKFRTSKKEWLVSVRKVSEGTDIKRLQVLCYLTNTTSELFFRQLIGRVSRVRNMDDFEAYVYLPADPRLIRCAKNIENAQVQALKEQNENESKELEEKDLGELRLDSYSTSHEGTDVAFIGGERVSMAEYSRIQQVAERTSTPMQKVLQISQAMGILQDLKPAVDEHQTHVISKEDRMDALRRKCNKAAFRLSKLAGIEVKEIHCQFKQQKEMTELELQNKLSQLVKECNKL